MPIGAFTPPVKVPSKWTVAEFWKSLDWSVGDQDGDYDGFLHLHTNINGTELKVPILSDIVHEAARVQNH